MNTAFYLILFFTVFTTDSLRGEGLHLAVASNFKSTALMLAKIYQTKSKDKILISSASTGKLYTQIIHGAPYDIFFSADKKTPLLLEAKGKAVKNTRITYALGRLVLWAPDSKHLTSLYKTLNSQINILAMANPNLAPYGRASKEVLKNLHLWTHLKDKLVFGENIAQTFNYVFTNNAHAGLVALSQLNFSDHKFKKDFILVPSDLYSPIEQQLILLKKSPLATQFIQFIQTKKIKNIIKKNGYQISYKQDGDDNQPLKFFK